MKTKRSRRSNPTEKVLWGHKRGTEDWAEDIISTQPAKFEAAKIWAAERGYHRFRVSTMDLSKPPDFAGTVRRNPPSGAYKKIKTLWGTTEMVNVSPLREKRKQTLWRVRGARHRAERQIHQTLIAAAYDIHGTFPDEMVGASISDLIRYTGISIK